MAISEEKLIDLRVKQLEMIQGIITRMAGYSASSKSYCLTLVTAVAGAAVTLQKPLILPFAILIIFVFAMLDAQYLRLERRFRGVFNSVRAGNWQSMPDFQVGLEDAPPISFWKSFFSWSVLFFYGILLVGLGLILAFVERTNGHL